MKSIHRVLLVPLLLITLAGCSALSVVNAVAPDDGVRVERNLSYGPAERHKLDIYRPAAASTPLPTVVFFYGGSWKRGDRADYAFAGRALAREGFMVAVADYRTYPEVMFPEFVHDGALAVKWLSLNASAFGGNTADIHLTGHSAGAHIAALIALDPTYLENAGTARSVLGRWVGLAGPYAFFPSEVRSVRDIFSNISDENQARPIAYADRGAPPALLLHGGDDRTVYPSNSVNLAKAIQRAGGSATAHIYDGVGHAPLVLSLTRPFSGIAPTLIDVAAFLKSGRTPDTLQAASH